MRDRIDTVAARSKLAMRREPYWMAIPDIEGAYIGFRRGPDTWIARLREDGKQRTHAVGRHADHKEAIRAARAWIRARQKGVRNFDATVKDACEAYIKNRESEKGLRAAKEVAARLFRNVIGRTFKTRVIPPNPIARIPLAKLRPDHLESWRDSLVPAGTEDEAQRRAKASANRELTTLVAALNFAYGRRMVASDLAWKTVAKFGDTQARKQRTLVSGSDRLKLLKHSTGAIYEFLQGLILTGARPIELARANVSDYDPTTGTLTLISYKGRATSPRKREVPLRPLKAEALIKKLVKDKLPAAPLFSRDDGKRWGHSDWDALVREARDRAGLAGITAYDLRHTWISEALAGGVDPLTVSEIAGTSLQQITITYGKLIENHAARAFEKVAML